MKKVKEIWLPSILKDIEVSNYGRLRKVVLLVKEKYIAEKVDGVYRRKLVYRKEKIGYEPMKGTVTSGYFRFRAQAVHRLVAIAHIPNPDNLPEVNHKEGNKLDNRAWMLEWCTGQYNIHHAVYKLGFTPHLGKKKVRVIKDGITICEQPTVTEAAKFVGGGSTHVSKVCKGQRPHYKGYQFEYM